MRDPDYGPEETAKDVDEDEIHQFRRIHVILENLVPMPKFYALV